MMATGAATAMKGTAARKSIKPRRQYPTSPDAKPNAVVANAAPIAAAGVASGYSGPMSGNTMMKTGVNSAAPPIPLSIAVVAMQIETGNMNQ